MDVVPQRTGLLHDLAHGLIGLIFPARCWMCSQLMDERRLLFCETCRQGLTVEPFQTCPRCSSTVGPHTDVSEGCPACRSQSLAFASARRMAPYDGLLREAVLRMKWRQGFADALAALWAETMAPRFSAEAIHAVTPTPLHWLRRFRRGYDQGEILAMALANALKLPCWRALRRRRSTTPQSSLHFPTQRRENVHGAFEVRSGFSFTGKTILLVDDVLTTGSTLHEAARTLKAAGAKRVIAAVVAHGR